MGAIVAATVFVLWDQTPADLLPNAGSLLQNLPASCLPFQVMSTASSLRGPVLPLEMLGPQMPETKRSHRVDHQLCGLVSLYV